MTLTSVERIQGELGQFHVTVREYPRYVDAQKCIACGECARKCPERVPDELNEGINDRRAIYLKYPQAVPLKYQIDAERCQRLQSGKCGVCEQVCPAGAIRFDDIERLISLRVGSVILALGHRTFDPTGLRTWGYDVFPNVLTSIEFERYLASSGPTEGRLVRPSDGKEVKRIAFLQCVGSRDYNKARHGYCSSVCCMVSLKEAMIAMDQVKDLEVDIFFMDMRTHGKGFERYFERARARGVQFHRCRVHSLEPANESGDIFFRYITDEGKQTWGEFDLVVLSVGMEPSAQGLELANTLGLQLNGDGFSMTSSFAPVRTSIPGIYVCGTFSGPKDIPQSIIQASAAAAEAMIPLADARYSLTEQPEPKPGRDISGEATRIGVLICHCGSNVASVIDVERLADYAMTLPHVVHVERSLFACSEDSQHILQERIVEKELNRIVVAACTPRTHEHLFQETLKSAGLNEYLFEMANIRNQGAWVHSTNPAAATAKACDILRMAVAKAALLEPLAPVTVTVNPQALVVGGGVAGMVTALGLADQGFPVHLVEKSSQLGGNARHLFKTWKGESIADFVDQLVARVKEHALITVHMRGQVTQAEGFMGSFRSTITKPHCTTTMDHGVTILAVGGQAYKPDEYGYGQSPRILTALEFDKLHLVGDERIKYGRDFVFIQCVGSRVPERPYCSRVCCTHSIQSAIALKQEDPNRNVFVLYRDIRSFGLREALYKTARELGVVFIHYDLHQKPLVRMRDADLNVVAWDHVLQDGFSIRADVVVLAAAIVPHPEVGELARIYRIPVDEDGFLQEAHVKLRPVDFAGEGLFLAGIAHYPKPIEEVVSQALAAVARAATVLSNRRIELDTIKACVDDAACDGCALCPDVCPYHAITMEPIPGSEGRQTVRVNLARCKGCGICQATCPKDAINVGGFTTRQLSAQVRAALS